MNCKQANRLPIKDIVESFGLQNGIPKGSEIWYCSPFRVEDKPSFKINIESNRWYDFGKSLKAGGTVIDFVVELKNCSINEALEYLDGSSITMSKNLGKQLFSFPEQAAKKFTSIEEPSKKEIKSKLEIINVKSLKNPALLQYIQSRKVNLDIATKYLEEIYIKNIQSGKTYFALCFKNDSGGYEWRNKYMRGVIGNKDTTSIENTPNLSKIAVFEGFIDFLSYLTYIKGEIPHTDYIILNSVTMVEKAINIIRSKKYTSIDLFLDNDAAGNNAITQFNKELSLPITDKRNEYISFKDFNDFINNKHIRIQT